MFDNISEKIKNLATVLTVLGFIASFIACIALISMEQVGAGLLTGGLGCLFSWISSFILYGFGELIEKATEIAQNTKTSTNLAVADAIEKASPENTGNIDSLQIRANAFETYKDEQPQPTEEDTWNTPLPNECPSCFG